MPTAQDKQQVQGVIEEWERALQAASPGRLKALWDQSYPQLLYIAEENDDALTDWGAIDKYYDALPQFVEKMDGKFDNLTVDVIGDAAYAYITFVMNVDVKGGGPMVFNGRNTFVLRKTGGQWKMIHYHESLSKDHSHETWGHTFHA
jgi:ketosteroid isomerase-like protein